MQTPSYLSTSMALTTQDVGNKNLCSKSYLVASLADIGPSLDLEKATRAHEYINEY